MQLPNTILKVTYKAVCEKMLLKITQKYQIHHKCDVNYIPFFILVGSKKKNYIPFYGHIILG